MVKSMDNYSTKLREVGPTAWWGNGFWHQPWYVRNVLCADGRRRTAYLGTDADTFFSWPARVKIQGKWVKGFVTAHCGYDFYVEADDTVFTAYQD